MRHDTLNMDAQTVLEGAEERRKVNGNLLVVQFILIQSRWWWWGGGRIDETSIHLSMLQLQTSLKH